MGLPEMGNVRDDLTGDPRCRSRARSLAVDGAGRRDMLEKGQGRQHGSLEMEARTEVQSAGDGEEDGGAACRRWGWGRGWRHGLPEMGMGKTGRGWRHALPRWGRGWNRASTYPSQAPVTICLESSRPPSPLPPALSRGQASHRRRKEGEGGRPAPPGEVRSRGHISPQRKVGEGAGRRFSQHREVRRRRGELGTDGRG